MCTARQTAYEESCCYLKTGAEDKISLTSGVGGCDKFLCESLCWTKGEDLKSDVNVEVLTKAPKVEDMKLRTACCCCYCGCQKPGAIKSFYDLAACFQIKEDRSMLCCLMSQDLGCVEKGETRACWSNICFDKQCDCETMMKDSSVPCICMDHAQKCSCLCIFRSAVKCGCLLCPKDGMVCIGEKLQCCCLFYKCAFPCNNEVPFELGLCGVMIKNGTETIKTWEGAHSDQVLGGNDSVADSAMKMFTGAPPAPEFIERS